MNRQQIIDKLAEILAAEKGDEEVLSVNYSEDMGLYSDLGLNSIGLLYMVISVEESFNIRFDNVKMSDFETLGDVVDYIQAVI